MFEIGKDYAIKTIETSGGEWTDARGVWTVVDVNGTLLKLRNPFRPDLILNTASWHFVSAELVDKKPSSSNLIEVDTDELDRLI